MRKININQYGIEDLLFIGFYLSLSASIIYGYVMNVYSIWNTIGLAITGKFILRVIGVFMFPLGVILGYF